MFKDRFFDKVFCLSVIEQLSKEVALKSIKEKVRVLKKGGLLIITLDNDGDHVNPELVGKFEGLIKYSGLKLDGASNFKNLYLKMFLIILMWLVLYLKKYFSFFPTKVRRN